MGESIGIRNDLHYGYAIYCGKCKQQGIEPVSFREWAKISSEYDIEWEAAKVEYDEADKIGVDHA